MLVRELARRTGNGDMIELHLDESVDAKALLGTCVRGCMRGVHFVYGPPFPHVQTAMNHVTVRAGTCARTCRASSGGARAR